MITCNNCKATNVKVHDLNFARLKREGEPAAKAGPPKYQFYCRNCSEIWESDPQAYEMYFEYANLKPRTTLVAQNMGSDGSYHAQYIKPEDLMRSIELARTLISKYKSHLDLSPGEWFEIRRDAGN